MSADPASMAGPRPSASIADLIEFVHRQRRIFVLTGAGISTASGIAAYRDAAGNWQHSPPIQLQPFLGCSAARQRYWARSLIGWPRFAAARPNGAHRALARLERAGYVHQVITQNVDGLHQQAGAQRVIDLHGRLDQVICLSCRARQPRAAVQRWLEEHNPGYATIAAQIRPDGDARLDEDYDLSGFEVPHCDRCAGVLKPDVVFFGENVPKPRVDLALRQLRAAQAVLVVGSSLMVYSGYRFCRAAQTLQLPVAAVNLGRTRADDQLNLKLTVPCAAALGQVADELAGPLVA